MVWARLPIVRQLNYWHNSLVLTTVNEEMAKIPAEKAREYQQRYKAKHPEKVKEMNRAWIAKTVNATTNQRANIGSS